MENKVDTYGIENVNFSLIERDDDRWELFKQQRLERGFDDSELWNLNDSIARFIYPRLKAFSEDTISYPIGLTPKKWERILNDMVLAFKLIIEDDEDENGNLLPKEVIDENLKKIKKGLNYFAKYFLSLWD